MAKRETAQPVYFEVTVTAVRDVDGARFRPGVTYTVRDDIAAALGAAVATKRQV
jgi:hypothetical protein